MLAWGLVELVANTAVRFAARLITAALVVVDGVVLTTDPLAAKPFSKSWPSASVHYQVIPHYALILTHLVVALAALAVLAVCVTRERAGAATAWPPAVTALAGAALLLVIMRLSLPSPVYPVLSLIAAGLVWFGASRIGDVRAAPARDAVDLAAVAERARRQRPSRRTSWWPGDPRRTTSTRRASRLGAGRPASPVTVTATGRRAAGIRAPGAVSPGTASPGTVWPRTVWPGMAWPGMVSPGTGAIGSAPIGAGATAIGAGVTGWTRTGRRGGAMSRGHPVPSPPPA